MVQNLTVPYVQLEVNSKLRGYLLVTAQVGRGGRKRFETFRGWDRMEISETFRRTKVIVRVMVEGPTCHMPVGVTHQSQAASAHRRCLLQSLNVVE
jgi:hypothetical protein